MNHLIAIYNGEDVNILNIGINGSSIYMIYINFLDELRKATLHSDQQNITFEIFSSASFKESDKIINCIINGESVKIVDIEINGDTVNLIYIDDMNRLKIEKKVISILNEESTIIATSCIMV